MPCCHSSHLFLSSRPTGIVHGYQGMYISIRLAMPTLIKVGMIIDTIMAEIITFAIQVVYRFLFFDLFAIGER